MSLHVYKYFYAFFLQEYKSSAIFFWTSIFIPIALALSFVARPTIPTHSSIFDCLGIEIGDTLESNETSIETAKKLFFCGFDNDFNEDFGIFGHFMNVVNITTCFLTSTILLAIATNIMEAFFYQRIFRFMKR